MADFISLPYKKSTDVDIVKPLKNLIESIHGSDTNCVDQLKELAKLRSAAIWKIFEKCSLDVVYDYYDQLASLETKIPPQDVTIPFKWKDAFDKGSIFGGRMSLTINSLAWERACIQYNMAALQSAIASSVNTESDDDLKHATKLFQQSAGLLAALKSSAGAAAGSAHTTPDLSPDTLHAMSMMMLAQAQELMLIKSVRDGMKSSAVAKVCAGVAELYEETLRAMNKEAVKPLWEREWINTISTKARLFSGLSQYWFCGSSAGYGERVSRLEAAMALIPTTSQRPYNEWMAKCKAAANDARKDNDFIYHERIPDFNSLPAVVGARLAQPLPAPAKWGNSKDLLSDLPALEEASRMAANKAEKAATLQHLRQQLKQATEMLNSVLTSMNLPACVEADSCSGVPESLKSRAEAVKAAGGADKLQHLMAELPELLKRNTEILDEAERMLREESSEDSAQRQKYAERWTPAPSEQLTVPLRDSAAKYRRIIEDAVRADLVVKSKWESHRSGVEELGRGSEALTLPMGQGNSAIVQLKPLMAQVTAMQEARQSIESELSSPSIDPSTAKERVQQSLSTQENLLSQLQSCASQPLPTQPRTEVMGRLIAAHDAFQELLSNLNEGIKFYNDLTQLLVSFQNKVTDFCFARRTERDELLKELRNSNNTPQTQHRQPPPRPAPPAPQQQQQPSLPYPMQPQGMPVPYAPSGVPFAPTAAPYYYAPMPMAYNPYATLPFPNQYPPYQPRPPQ